MDRAMCERRETVRSLRIRKVVLYVKACVNAWNETIRNVCPDVARVMEEGKIFHLVLSSLWIFQKSKNKKKGRV